MTQDQQLKPKDFYLDRERHRHECAVRQLIMWRQEWGLKVFREYLYKHKLPTEVINDYQDQWLKGNRATEKGEWK
jgi:hypothetical protein